MKFEILNRWTGSVQITAEIECAADAFPSIKLGLAVKWAHETGADLTGADLTRADLTGADLTRADLTDADLTRADLTGADLTGADLTGADLTGADLTRADLTGADLTRADLTGADLTRADLTDADLTRADLTGADLTRADLTRADLTGIRNDLWDVLLRAPGEVPGLLDALRGGRVDGSTYEGECACLVGTIANVRHAKVDALGSGLKPDSARPIERWFMGIRRGDTPDSNAVAKITEVWIVEFLMLTSAAVQTAGAPGAGVDLAGVIGSIANQFAGEVYGLLSRNYSEAENDDIQGAAEEAARKLLPGILAARDREIDALRRSGGVSDELRRLSEAYEVIRWLSSEPGGPGEGLVSEPEDVSEREAWSNAAPAHWTKTLDTANRARTASGAQGGEAE